MTYKRFNYVAFDGFTDNEEFITPYQVVKLLNELHEENTMLKLQVETKLFSRRELEKENEQLKKENQGIQDKVMRLLDYVELKQCVTRTEIKTWWHGDVK